MSLKIPFVCAIGSNWGHGWRNRTKWATHQMVVEWMRSNLAGLFTPPRV